MKNLQGILVKRLEFINKLVYYLCLVHLSTVVYFHFFRQLVLKENELSRQGKEPEIPDFKEIMDMDYAIVLYHKDIKECCNNEPKDLAAKLTREKLCNLFPDLAPDILSELLMAHDNNFQSTVEVRTYNH